VIYILYRRAQAMPPHLRRSEYVKLGLIVMVLVVVGLTLTGKMHWVGAALTGLLVAMRQSLPLLTRVFPMLMSWKSNKANAQQSTVESPILRMQMDHNTGALNGEVLQGQFIGWRLDDMARAELEVLFSYCRTQDQDSTQLLDSYLQQRFPGEGPFGETNQPPPNSNHSGAMQRKEALAVLGVAEDASEEDIVAAHRTLIQKLHPDRGGNDYLAAKVNQAKDFLLS